MLASSEYPLTDVPLDHQLFHMLYDVGEIPQIPSIELVSHGRTHLRAGQTTVRCRMSARSRIAEAFTDLLNRAIGQPKEQPQDINLKKQARVLLFALAPGDAPRFLPPKPGDEV